MYCHGLISLLTLASVASLSVKSNVLGRPPPSIFVDNDARIQRSGIADEDAEGLYQGDVMQMGEQRRELLGGKVIAHSAKLWGESAGDVINSARLDSITTPDTTTTDTTTKTKKTTTTTTPTTTPTTTSTKTKKSTTTPTTTTHTTTPTTTSTKTKKSTTTPTTTTTTTTTTKTKKTTTTPTKTTPTTTPTPTTIPPGCTVTNSGPVPLLASLTGSCSLNKVSASTYNLDSPNYPSRYSSSDACKGWFSTDEPRYVRVTPVAVDIGMADQLSIKHVSQTVASVTNARMGVNLVFPSSSTSMSFLADKKKPGNNFSFNMEVVNSNCHQIINIPLGVTCTLSIPRDYPPGTICEWWIKAPPGRKVRVTFSRFNVGNKQCLEDYMDIDTKGDPQYTSATRYCGNNLQSPGTVASKKNQINILMNGRDGHFGGFDATYTAV